MFKVFTRLSRMVRNLRTILSDGLSFFASVWRRRTALAAENLFLRKQLALFREREKKAMPTTPADRFVFSKLARWFEGRTTDSLLCDIYSGSLIGVKARAILRVLLRRTPASRRPAQPSAATRESRPRPALIV